MIMLRCNLGIEFEGVKDLPETINNQALWDFFQEAYQVYKNTRWESLAEAFCNLMEKPIVIE